MKKIKYLYGKLKEHRAELGLWGTFKWLLFAIRFRTLLFFGRVSDYTKEGNINEDEEDYEYITKKDSRNIFIFSGIPFYDIGGGQRGAQLTRTFNQLGYNVYYIFANYSSESKIYRMEIPTIVHKHIDKYPLESFTNHIKKDDVLIIEFPHAKFIPYIEEAKSVGAKIVYENIDNWETSLGGDLFSRDNLNLILKNSNLLVGTAKPLVKQLEGYIKELKINKPIIYEANAVDDALFNMHKPFKKPSDFVDGEKVLLYYGSLWGEWFDWSLIYETAKKFPSYSILLIGEDKNLGDKKDDAPKNVHFLGIKKQSDLPAYLHFSDYALLPFKVDKIGEYVSPLKIFEYISMGKRVISTGLPEVIGFPNVHIGNTPKEWSSILRKNPSIDLEASNAFIGQNNWYCRCVEILRGLNIENKIPQKFINNISIIILNYNNKKCIFDCIDGLIRYSKRYKYEIIVVDNQSTDGSYELLRDNYGKKIKLIRNTKNGCSSGRNLGIKESTREYILMLDSDQFALHSNWLDCYLLLLNEYPKLGAVGWAAGYIRRHKNDTTPIVDYYPYRFMPANALFRSDIDYLGSGGLLAKRSTLKKAGLFDERYDPTCYEDTDLSFAIKNAGFQIVYSPYLNIYHIPHQTTKNGEINHNAVLEEHEKIFFEKWNNENPSLLEVDYRKMAKDKKKTKK